MQMHPVFCKKDEQMFLRNYVHLKFKINLHY